MKLQNAFQKTVLILIGILIAFTAVFLTGTTNLDERSQIGRYRMAAITRNGFPDIFVIDTATGVVKWVGDDEGKPFNRIKGH